MRGNLPDGLHQLKQTHNCRVRMRGNCTGHYCPQVLNSTFCSQTGGECNLYREEGVVFATIKTGIKLTDGDLNGV